MDYSTSLLLNRRAFAPPSSPNRTHQRVQSVDHNWQRCHPEQPAPLYPPVLWSSDLYAHSQGQSDVSQGLLTQAEYPESSQRTALSPSPSNALPYPHPRSLSRSSTTYSPDTDVMFVHHPYGDASATTPPSSTNSRPASAAAPEPQLHPPVVQLEPSNASTTDSADHGALKTEDDEPLGFVMEPGTSTGGGCLSFSPLPMEVPLRATQASDDMRKMMNVFRLNPFANTEGRRGGSCFSDSSSGPPSSESSPKHLEARPLEEEPLLFEFQVELDRPDILSPDPDSDSGSDEGSSGGQDDSPLSTPPLPAVDLINDDDNLNLHSFPPEFQLHKEASFDSLSNSIPPQAGLLNWDNHDFASDGSSSLYSWDGDREIDSSDGGRRSAAGHHSGASRLHTTVSHPYIRKSARNLYQPQEQREYPQPSPSPPHGGNMYHQIPRYAHGQQQQHATSDYFNSSVRMESGTGIYLDDGSAPTAIHHHAALPHRTMAVGNSTNANNSTTSPSSTSPYTHEPMVSSIMMRHGQDSLGGHGGSFSTSMTPPHRRWSMPETTASSLGNSAHAHNHGYGQIMVPSLPVQSYMIH
ncbi:hypothetical protein CC1G_07655 [Coprinopsis cinerea okayama7|uniref:Uncharacterized protein n=1 Tax=Coprinopsis cinerea (strain Okayama-7 / 130 / ATCC MYA-4618 / FGSC 9003) TaxID=240176 RepID=A8NC51_COPC7|nr:hypothetical protein CC1G_07655 [Coprinopsis cinerea okayama7\|eukprot:XP_001832395.1 hypothetical protein CC1G_07655 [Coprinopsis cinerea okayama7\